MGSTTVVVGTIIPDAHVIGSRILEYTLTDAGFHPVFLGALTSQEEFIDAAIETKASAIWVSSLCGTGIIDCEGLREKCDEAGLQDVKLYAGGMLTSTDERWESIEKRFNEIGFDRVYPPGTPAEKPIAYLKKDLGLE